MSEKIEPAVTPEEWKEFRAGELHTTRLGFHATAALSLHGKPFGFTWEDVDQLRESAAYIGRVVDVESFFYESDDVNSETLCASLLSLATRIASLLPPRKP